MLQVSNHFLNLQLIVLVGGGLRCGLSKSFLSFLNGSGFLWDGDVILGVLGNELEKRFKAAVTLVINELLGTSGLELESRESGDLEGGVGGNIVLSGIHLSTVRIR